ncbi:hypothetical protein STEG23_011429, partial [Scotinomys teguina]
IAHGQQSMEGHLVAQWLTFATVKVNAICRLEVFVTLFFSPDWLRLPQAYIELFLYVKSSLHLWNKAPLVIVDVPFDEFLDSVYCDVMGPYTQCLEG